MSMTPRSIKIPEKDYEELLKIVGERQAVSGETIGASDLIREAIKNLITENAGRDGLLQLPIVDEIYQPVGRRVLFVDHLKGRRPLYRRDYATKSYTHQGNHGVVQQFLDAEEFAIKCFPISVNPTWEMYANNIDRNDVEKKSTDSVMREEDAQFFSRASSSVPNDHRIYMIAGDSCDHSMDALCGKIIEHGLTPKNIVCNRSKETMVQKWRSDHWDEIARRLSYLEDIKIISSSMCPSNQLFVFADPLLVGVLAIDHDITVIEANEPTRLRYGLVIWEHVGIEITNDYAISQLIIADEEV